MKHRDYHIGPGAVSLLLIIVVVSMSVLGLLSMIGARGDYKLTERAISLAEAGQTASVDAEKALAGLDDLLIVCREESEDDQQYIGLVGEAIAEEMTLEGRIIRWKVDVADGRTLNCAIEVLPFGETDRFLWKEHYFSATGMAAEE